jgi:hypothetical protein
MIRKAIIYDFITLGKKFVVVLAMASWQNDDEKKG